MFIYNANMEKERLDDVNMGFGGDISIESYTDKSVVVRGQGTKLFRDKLKELGGRWNPKLTGGPGWIFSSKKREDLQALLFGEKKSVSDNGFIPKPIKCLKFFKKGKDIEKEIKLIDQFCKKVHSEDTEGSVKYFLKLQLVTQCLFVENAWDIISDNVQYTEKSHQFSMSLFKMLNNPDIKKSEIYSRISEINKLHIGKTVKKTTVKERAKPRTSPGKYDKEGQRKPEPSGIDDPLYIFYTSLYKQKPKSPLAITWLTEHGVFDDSERRELLSKYKKLADKNLLIR